MFGLSGGAIAGIAGGLASLAGGVIGGNAAESAANTQAGAARYAADIANKQWQTTNEQEAPFRQGGYGAMSQLNYLLGLGGPQGVSGSPSGTPAPGGPSGYYGGSDFYPTTGVQVGNGGGWSGGGVSNGAPGTPSATGSTAGGYGSLLKPFSIDDFHNLSPAYQFQLQQGQQGVLSGDASAAGALSGAAQKDLIGYNNNMANTAFNNAFNQYQTQQGNIYSRLAGIASLGQDATANTGSIGANLAGSAAQSVTNAGTAAAAGQVGAANAWSGALGNASYLPWLMSGTKSSSPVMDTGFGE